MNERGCEKAWGMGNSQLLDGLHGIKKMMATPLVERGWPVWPPLDNSSRPFYRKREMVII